MFTGIIQAVGHIDSVTPLGEDIKLQINAADLGLEDVVIGDSIAVNGVCLTVTQLIELNGIKTHFTAHVSTETLKVTTGLNHTQSVNLEKALRLNDRLGGHLVSGHVDGIGKVVIFSDLGDCWTLAIEAPRALSKYIAKKGSICVNGVSLTVNSIGKNTFTMNIIPHTLQHTMFNQLKIGSQVNLEIDQIARYVERMTEWANEI
ncbi:MAG: riboflavin synthase [Pseudomonadota bacterium]